MDKNVGGLDRVVRFIVSGGLLLAAIASLANVIDIGGGTVLSVTLLVAGLIVLFPAVTQRCLPYTLLGINTCPISERD